MITLKTYNIKPVIFKIKNIYINLAISSNYKTLFTSRVLLSPNKSTDADIDPTTGPNNKEPVYVGDIFKCTNPDTLVATYKDLNNLQKQYIEKDRQLSNLAQYIKDNAELKARAETVEETIKEIEHMR